MPSILQQFSGERLHVVQFHVFPGSPIDIPLSHEAAHMGKYVLVNCAIDNSETFIMEWDVPRNVLIGDDASTFKKHIEGSWPELTRQKEEDEDHRSEIEVPGLGMLGFIIRHKRDIHYSQPVLNFYKTRPRDSRLN